MVGTEGEFEKLAYEAALRGLDKQERGLEELRARTGVLLAASAIAASFLGQAAFSMPGPRGLTLTALAAFITSMGASVFVLLPKRDLVFAEAGASLYESFYDERIDLPEVYRQLAYALDQFWLTNDRTVELAVRACSVAAGALVVEVLCLAALLGDRII